MIIKRIILIVLDSLGVGELPDAIEYGDVGSNTLKNIYLNSDKLNIPNLEKLGILNIKGLEDIRKTNSFKGTIGRCKEKSKGKDTTTGHWEISGLILDKPFPVYPNGYPKDIIARFEKEIGRKVIGNVVASGTEIIKELGVKHMNTGSPIVYTSADSVFQIAAHEEIIPLEKLYEMCRIARNILIGEHNVGRIIARPFVGYEGSFTRIENRKDFSVKPYKKTMLDFIKESGKEVIAIGKIKDIFSNQGISKSLHTKNNSTGIDETIKEINKDTQGLIFTNLVDFDMLYGHRNNVDGYAEALSYFDYKLTDIIDALKDDDILILTGDHGCDPTTKSTDHSREYIPLILYNKFIEQVNLGTLSSFACIGKTILDLFNIENDINGDSFKNRLKFLSM